MIFKNISATKVNWSKSEAVLVGNWLNGEPKLPEGLSWTKEGFKFLGVFGVLYKGRVLIINNLIVSALWH